MDSSDVTHWVSSGADVCQELATLSEGFSGAEIEQAVIASLYDAFYADRGLTREDLIRSIRDTVPLSVTQREQLTTLRTWAEKRAVLATAREDREANLPETNDSDSRPGKQGGRLVDFDL